MKAALSAMRVVAAAVSLALCAALFAPAAHALQTPPPPQEQPPQPPAPPDDMPATPKQITVGEFLIQVALALKLQAPQGGFTAESASFALRGKGVAVDTAPATMLTEADAVKVLDGLGYRVETKTPSRTVNDQQARLLITTFLTVNPAN